MQVVGLLPDDEVCRRLVEGEESGASILRS